MSKAHGLQGALTVTVHRCKDLKDVQIVGKQDPYCKVKIGSEKFKTKVAEDGGREPVWNQTFLFNLDAKSSEQDMIHFEVLNHNLTTDDVIGRCDVKILELVKTLNQKKFIQVVDKDNFTKMCGQLEVTVEFKGTGLPETSPTPQPAVVQPTPAPVQPVSPQPIVQQQPVQQVQQPVYPQQVQQPVYPQVQQPISPMYASGQQPMYQQQPMGMQPMMQQQPVMGMMPMMQPAVVMQPMMYASAQPIVAQQQYQDGMEIMDPRHQHALRHLSSVYQGIYTCNGCGTEGRGKVFHCALCDFDLHPHCIQRGY